MSSDGGVLREWKGIDRFNLLFKRILELLGDVDARKEPADFSLDVCVFERTERLGFAGRVQRPSRHLKFDQSARTHRLQTIASP